jgi:hypothetical protein
MSFWTGLEAFTGHQPGAFTGMTMKDLFDKDMWDRMPRTWSGQRTPVGATESARQLDIRTGRAGEPMMTNWARGGGGQTPTPVPQPAFSSPMQPEGALAGPSQYPQTSAYVPTPRAQARPLPAFIPGVSPTQGLDSIRHWGTGNPNTPGMMAADPTWAGGLRGAGLNAQTTTPPMLDMTTVKKITDDASPNTITQTVKQKVPANPTNTLMNMGRKFMGGWQDLARKRGEDEMRFRQNYNHPLRGDY